MEVTVQQAIGPRANATNAQGLPAAKLRFKANDTQIYMYNASGFTALQTGNRLGAGGAGTGGTGSFSNGTLFVFLTSTESNTTDFVIRYSQPNEAGLYRIYDKKASAWPVRCLKDE